MNVIDVNVKNGYKVIVDNGIFDKIPEYALTLADYTTVTIVSDSNVAPLYIERLKKGFLRANKRVLTYVIEAGEQSKNLSNYAAILSFLANNDFKRKDLLVALGGGVVGDLTGFVASTYHRGVDFIQVPTTLLAGIDSSVGGKTAVDIKEGKNLVGAFYQPKGVFFDIETLNTLPEKEMINGFGELVKYGILMGGTLWKNLLSDNLSLENCIADSIRYKAEIVEKDEFDNGVRALLNLGHTLAHSVENLSDYTVPHGLAVGYGIRRIAKACHNNGLLQNSEYKQIINVLDKFSLTYIAPFSDNALIRASVKDKKAFADSINIIVINAIGNCSIQKFKLDKLGEFFND